VIHPKQTNNGSSLLGSEVVWDGVTRARYLTMRTGHLMSTGTEGAVGYNHPSLLALEAMRNEWGNEERAKKERRAGATLIDASNVSVVLVT